MKKIFSFKRKTATDSGTEYDNPELELGYGNNLYGRQLACATEDESRIHPADQLDIDSNDQSHICPKDQLSDIGPDERSKRNERNVTSEALQVLERLGLSSSLSISIFYTARTLDPTSSTYTDICNYVRNGQEHDYGIQVVSILRLVRQNDFEFHHMPESRDKFRMMLWHGTKKESIQSILRDGFRLPKPRGQMFGRGIYFADRVSKSCNYCFDSKKQKKPTPGTRAFLFLCDVLLGEMYNAVNPHNKWSYAPKEFGKTFHSVVCTGEKVPDRCFSKYYYKSLMPLGKTVSNDKFSRYTVAYNEYIVYNVDHIKIPFLVEVEFFAKPILEDTNSLNGNNSNSVLQSAS